MCWLTQLHGLRALEVVGAIAAVPLCVELLK